MKTEENEIKNYYLKDYTIKVVDKFYITNTQ